MTQHHLVKHHAPLVAISVEQGSKMGDLANKIQWICRFHVQQDVLNVPQKGISLLGIPCGHKEIVNVSETDIVLVWIGHFLCDVLVRRLWRGWSVCNWLFQFDLFHHRLSFKWWRI